MSDFSINEFRDHMEERKRLTLNEGRMLLDEIEQARAEIARLRLHEETEQPQQAPPPPIPEPEPPQELKALLDEIDAATTHHAPDSVARSVHRWCQEWLNLRGRLMAFSGHEQQVQHQIDQMAQQADTILQMLNIWLSERKGG